MSGGPRAGVVEDCRVAPSMSVDDLVECYSRIHGFMAGHLAEAIEVLGSELSGARLRVLTFTGNLVATGLRGILAQLIDSGLFNVIITTAGALDHDIARHMGGEYLKGFFEADDRELYEREIHRLGNVFIPFNSYGVLVERFVGRLVEDLGEGVYGVYEVLQRAGSLMKDDISSIIGAARRGEAFMFVPGWADGAFGTALYTESQRRGVRLIIDYFRDMEKLSELFFPQEGRAVALIVGGGISKHHAIWWAQFRGGFDSVVYITTAVEYDGSLSGAHPREAVSWGKVKASGRRVVVYGDATVILPILAAALLGRTRYLS